MPFAVALWPKGNLMNDLSDFFDVSKLQATAKLLLDLVVERVVDPLFWMQFAVIAVVFVLARWLVTPLLKKLLDRLSAACTRVVGDTESTKESSPKPSPDFRKARGTPVRPVASGKITSTDPLTRR